MAYNEREKKRRIRSKLRVVAISLTFLYLVFRSVPTLLANNAKTILPEKDLLVQKKLAQGFIMKNELVIRSTGSGELEIFANEGDRTSAGVKVASVSGANYNSSLKQELEQIEKSILALERSEADTELMIKELDQVEDVQEVLGIQLQQLINKGDFDQIYLVKEKITLYNSKAEDEATEDEANHDEKLNSQSLDKLKSRKENITSEIDSNFVNHYTSTGGILSYNIDGYEEVYIPKDFEEILYDKLKLDNKKDINENKKTTVDSNEPIYKIIDNFEWYMAIKIEDIKEIEDYEIRDLISIEMAEDKEELRGRIIAINISKDKAVIVIKFNTKLHEYYDVRFPEVYVIKNKVEGFKIPSKAVEEKDSVKGVYIKDAGGIIRFRPINIIGEEGNFI